MSISTGRGDRGDTGLVDGSRVPKDDPRIETYGTVDELNSAIGVARALASGASFDGELAQISSRLFDLGSDLATPRAGLGGAPALRLGADVVPLLEGWIHREEAALPRLKNFILPGGTPLAAQLHVARTICRRAERLLVSHHRATGEGAAAIVFLNRLSDLLFLYARRANHDASVPDAEWRPRG